LENATQEGSSIPIEQVQAQADALVLDVVEALDGDAEAELVKSLLQLRQTLETQNTGEARSTETEAARAQVVNLINTFFRDRLAAMPTIKEYVDRMQAEEAGAVEARYGARAASNAGFGRAPMSVPITAPSRKTLIVGSDIAP